MTIMKNNDITRILFVCLGNICRSPAAEAMLSVLVDRNGLSNRVVVDSAGTYGGHAGERSDARMRSAAAARGIAMTHRARQVREEDFERFDLIIAMDDNNYEALFALPLIEQRSRRFTAFVSSYATIPIGRISPTPTMRGTRVLSLFLTYWKMVVPNCLIS